MDSTRFDRIATALSGETGRRDTLRLLGASLLGVGGLAVLGAAEGDARKKGKKRKEEEQGQRQWQGRTRVKGRCGGQCPRCAPGTTCSDRSECISALCTGGVCSQPASARRVRHWTRTVTPVSARDTQDGVSYCSRKTGRFLADGDVRAMHSPGKLHCHSECRRVSASIPCGGPL